MDRRESRIVLASASPRRAELLALAGIEFEGMPSGVDEDSLHADNHRQLAMRLARAKAQHVMAGLGVGRVVLGADTLVCLGDERLAKPADAAEARAMIRRLRNRAHDVITGIAIGRVGGRVLEDAVVTTVWFGDVPDADIEAYIATAEPYDKAGAYGIQGWAGRYIPRIDGDYFNVMGLPLARTVELLSEFVEVSHARIPKPPRIGA